MEEVAAASGDGQRWYQLYWPKDRAVAASFLGRAQAAGYSVLVVTLDTRILAWRPRDLDNGYLPFLQGVGIQNYLSDPAFQAGLVSPVDVDPDSAVLRYTQMFGDLSLTWDDIPFLRQHWHGPIVLKGILSAADAVRAAEAGVDGIIVSNHGGRQVDGAIAALDALPAVAQAVGSRLAVLFDSGIRGGADMLKALALGAQAVLDRPPVRVRPGTRRRGWRPARAAVAADRLRAHDAARGPVPAQRARARLPAAPAVARATTADGGTAMDLQQIGLRHPVADLIRDIQNNKTGIPRRTFVAEGLYEINMVLATGVDVDAFLWSPEAAYSDEAQRPRRRARRSAPGGRIRSRRRRWSGSPSGPTRTA